MHEPQLIGIISASAAAFLISSLGTTHRYLLLRDLHFRQLAIVEVVAALAYAACTIGLAFAGFGVWSLVVGGLAQAAVGSIAMWLVSAWRPRFAFDLAGIRGLMSFGAKAWVGGILGYAQESGDYFIIGRALGPAPLGFYTMAFNLANVPRTRLGSVVSMVSFTGFSRIQDDAEKVRRGFLRVVRYISLVSFPLLTGMILLAGEFIVVVYGPNWVESVRPLQLLSAAAIPASLTSAMPAVLLAKNRAGLHVRLSIASTIAFFACVIGGVQWGTVGVAAALLIHATVFFGIVSHFVRGVVGAAVLDYFSALLPAAVGSVVMAGAVALFRLGLLQVSCGPLVVLLLGVLVGAIVYLAVLFAMRIPELAEVRQMVRDMRRGPRTQLPAIEPEV